MPVHEYDGHGLARQGCDLHFEPFSSELQELSLCVENTASRVDLRLLCVLALLPTSASADMETDVDRFLRANMLNWLIGGTDAHAKNYSLLIGPADEIRLAPLYDVSSQLPYPGLVSQRVSMKIGDHYDIARVRIADWRKQARACAVDEDRVLAMLADIARALPDHISAARDQAIRDGLDRAVVTRFAKLLTKHVKERSSVIVAR